jgi:hypothetical protein
MSNIDFKQDWEWFERRLREDGEPESGIAEIKEQIRQDWDDPELRLCWINQVKEEADFMRSLYTNTGINERIKNAKANVL